jgi:hypothetical protein
VNLTTHHTRLGREPYTIYENQPEGRFTSDNQNFIFVATYTPRGVEVSIPGAPPSW